MKSHYGGIVFDSRGNVLSKIAQLLGSPPVNDSQRAVRITIGCILYKRVIIRS